MRKAASPLMITGSRRYVAQLDQPGDLAEVRRPVPTRPGKVTPRHSAFVSRTPCVGNQSYGRLPVVSLRYTTLWHDSSYHLPSGHGTHAQPSPSRRDPPGRHFRRYRHLGDRFRATAGRDARRAVARAQWQGRHQRRDGRSTGSCARRIRHDLAASAGEPRRLASGAGAEAGSCEDQAIGRGLSIPPAEFARTRSCMPPIPGQGEVRIRLGLPRAPMTLDVI